MEPVAAPEYCLLMINHWSTCMDKSQWASWVQAFFSVAAILAAVWITSRQMKHEVHLYRESQESERQRVAAALASLSDNASQLLGLIHRELDSREAVHDIAAGDRLPIHLPELDAVGQALGGIPLHDLPAELVTPAMKVAFLVRTFRTKVHTVLANYRTMDAEAYSGFFSTMSTLRSQLETVAADIAQAVPIDNETP